MSMKPRTRIMIAGAITGALLATSGVAYAVTSTATDSTTESTAVQSVQEKADFQSSEELLTGDLAAQVTAAAEAAVPGGTVVRVETDAQGAAYEAHMTDADGNPVTVTFDESLNVIATEADGRCMGRGSDRGHGSEDLLTGDLAAQVTVAAEAVVPGGTVVRVETDAQGAAYEARMTDADGNPVTVTFDESLNVISTNQGR